MSNFTVRFIGSGDAFGSGGRLQTCILVDAPEIRFTIDFGATSLIHQQGIDPNTIDVIFLTHLHGDYCGGIPFYLLYAMLSAKRTSPLTIVGPINTQKHLQKLQETLFAGSNVMKPKFRQVFKEIYPNKTLELLNLGVKAIDARHTRETNPLALRFQIGDKALAYTGDGEQSEALCKLFAGVDLLISECYFYNKPIKWHLNYPDIAQFSANKIVLTHMHSDMLAHIDDVPEMCAYDGCVVEI